MKPLFESTGAHVLVDGQFGSTGKGLFAGWLAAQPGQPEWAGVITNAGPNSGHTFYHEGEKHVLKQLPTFAVAHYLRGNMIPVYFSAGAIIDMDVLAKELKKYPGIEVTVNPQAVFVWSSDKAKEGSGTIAAVAGTRSGAGAALARKIERDERAVAGWGSNRGELEEIGVKVREFLFSAMELAYFVEVSQGFSLGIHSQFYPKVTSRECTVAQALADARISPRFLSKSYMCVRTYPIRVGNVDGFSSGDWYTDQKEIAWEDIGQKPELTTVTQRQRRIATFSNQQFWEAVSANTPDFVFVNFLNYLRGSQEHSDFYQRLMHLRDNSPRWFDMVGGWGPTNEDVDILG